MLFMELLLETTCWRCSWWLRKVPPQHWEWVCCLWWCCSRNIEWIFAGRCGSITTNHGRYALLGQISVRCSLEWTCLHRSGWPLGEDQASELLRCFYGKMLRLSIGSWSWIRMILWEIWAVLSVTIQLSLSSSTFSLPCQIFTNFLSRKLCSLKRDHCCQLEATPWP